MAVGVRKITNAGTKKVIGKFPSLKMNTVIWWESQIERDYIYLLEIDPDVLSYTGQPFKIPYTSNGKPRLYTPDFFVERRSKKQVVEVKPEHQVRSERNINLFRRIAPICQDWGWDFRIVTEQMIRIQPMLNNIKLLYRYARGPLTLQNYLDCLEYFRNQRPTKLKDAEQSLLSKGVLRELLLRLLYFDILETDLMKPINSESLIQLSPNAGKLERLKIR